MKKVYLVEQCFDYEGCILLGTFDNFDAANEYLKIIEDKRPSSDNDGYYITETEVHGSVESAMTRIEDLML